MNGIQEVGGSIPLSSTRKIKYLHRWRLSSRGNCYHFVTTVIGNRMATPLRVAFLFSGEPDEVLDLRPGELLGEMGIPHGHLDPGMTEDLLDGRQAPPTHPPFFLDSRALMRISTTSSFMETRRSLITVSSAAFLRRALTNPSGILIDIDFTEITSPCVSFISIKAIGHNMSRGKMPPAHLCHRETVRASALPLRVVGRELRRRDSRDWEKLFSI